MLGVVGDVDGFVDKQHRNAVLDAIGATQPGVVKELVVDKEQRSAVLRADQDAQQFLVKHNGD